MRSKRADINKVKMQNKIKHTLGVKKDGLRAKVGNLKNALNVWNSLLPIWRHY